MASAATAAPYMAPAAVYSSAAVYSPPPAYSAPPAYASASVSAAAAVYTTPSYGSGSSTWGSGSAYDSCVQRMIQNNPFSLTV